MARVTAAITVSADGYACGPNQSLDKPMGEGPIDVLHRWLLETPEENAAEVADLVGAGAFVMGRNMFGPIRGEWGLDWKGWWGDEPPYHGPVFVLTHHERDDLPMAGGTTFHFVTGGIDEALSRAVQAAGDGYVSIAGGVSTINQYLTAGLIDELTLSVAPVTLGAGERLFDGVPALGLEQVSSRAATHVTHLRYRVTTRRPASS